MQDSEIKDKPYLMPGEIAEMFGVTRATIRNWVRAGKLRAIGTPGGHRRYQRREVMEFARQRGLIPSTAVTDTLRILIVDDDRRVARFLQKRLKNFPVPIDSEVAHNGFEAGQKVASFDPDLLLLDIFMEGLDGFEVCRRLKDDPSTRDIRVIAITGHHTPEIEQRIVELGAETCLAKPIDKQTLIDVIGQIPMTGALRL